MYIEQVALTVDDYDEAISFFVDRLDFELVEDSPSLTNDGRQKRWVLVRPPGATTALLLARADGEHQRRAVGDQFAGRTGMFLRVDDFEVSYQRMCDAGSSSSPRGRETQVEEPPRSAMLRRFAETCSCVAVDAASVLIRVRCSGVS